MEESRRVCVRGLIYKEGKIFGQKLHKTSGDWWCTPGGGVDPLESLHDALRRELIEETGIEPIIGRLVLVQQFSTDGATSHGEDEQLEFFFIIENADDYENINLQDTTHGEAEVSEYGFVDPTEKNMLPAILQTTEITNALQNESPVIFYTRLNK